MRARVPWILGILIGISIVGIPGMYYRVVYDTQKRFREVSAGRFYRCGQMTADAFRKKIGDHGIKVVINLQDEFPDPLLSNGYWDSPHIRESQVCEEAGAKYVFLSWIGERGLLAKNLATPDNRPVVIDDFLKICDEANGKPILLHCMAGLHRTGALTAVYRMEYEGWSVEEAMRELRANGYGDRKANQSNDYIAEYLYQYKPRHPEKTEQRKRSIQK